MQINYAVKSCLCGTNLLKNFVDQPSHKLKINKFKFKAYVHLILEFTFEIPLYSKQHNIISRTINDTTVQVLHI